MQSIFVFVTKNVFFKFFLNIANLRKLETDRLAHSNFLDIFLMIV